MSSFTLIVMPDLIRHLESSENIGCARSLRLTPPPVGRPAAVYPDENRGRDDNLLETIVYGQAIINSGKETRICPSQE